MNERKHNSLAELKQVQTKLQNALVKAEVVHATIGGPTFSRHLQTFGKTGLERALADDRAADIQERIETNAIPHLNSRLDSTQERIKELEVERPKLITLWEDFLAEGRKLDGLYGNISRHVNEGRLPQSSLDNIIQLQTEHTVRGEMSELVKAKAVWEESKAEEASQDVKKAEEEKKRRLAQTSQEAPVTQFDQTEAAVLASLFLNRNGVKVKQDDRLLFAFDLPESYEFICQELVHRRANSPRVPLDQLAIIRSDVIRKVSAIFWGGNLDDVDKQEESVKELLTWLHSQDLDKFKGHLSQFLTESPTLKARSFKSFVETDTVERVWNLPNGNGSGYAKAENVLTEPVQPNVARVEAEKQLPTLKVNLETNEIQLEGWEKSKRIGSKIDWAVFQCLVESLKRGEPLAQRDQLEESAKSAGSTDKKVAANSVLRLRGILELDPKNPQIIIHISHQSKYFLHTGYRLNAEIELVDEEKKKAEIAVLKEKPKIPPRDTREVTLPDGQAVKVSGFKGQILEFFVAKGQGTTFLTDEVSLAIFGSTDREARKRTSTRIGEVNQNYLEKLGWRIINLTSPKDLSRQQKAQYSLIKLEKDETQPPEWEWEADTIRQVEPVEPEASKADEQDMLPVKEMEEHLPNLKINLKTREIQLEDWESPKKIRSNIDWAVFQCLVESLKLGEPLVQRHQLEEKAKSAGSTDKKVAANSILRLREIFEKNRSNPQIIIYTTDQSKNALIGGYRLNAEIESVGQLKDETVERESETLQTLGIELSDGQIVRTIGKNEISLKVFVKAEKEKKQVQLDQLAIALYGSDTRQNRKKAKRLNRYLKTVLLNPLGYTIHQSITFDELEQRIKAEYSLVKVTQETEAETEQSSGQVTQGLIETQAISREPDPLFAKGETENYEYLSKKVQEVLGFLSEDEIALLNDENN